MGKELRMGHLGDAETAEMGLGMVIQGMHIGNRDEAVYGKWLAKACDRYCNVHTLPNPFPLLLQLRLVKVNESLTTSVEGCSFSSVLLLRLKSSAHLDYF